MVGGAARGGAVGPVAVAAPSPLTEAGRVEFDRTVFAARADITNANATPTSAARVTTGHAGLAGNFDPFSLTGLLDTAGRYVGHGLSHLYHDAVKDLRGAGAYVDRRENSNPTSEADYEMVLGAWGQATGILNGALETAAHPLRTPESLATLVGATQGNPQDVIDATNMGKAAYQSVVIDPYNKGGVYGLAGSIAFNAFMLAGTDGTGAAVRGAADATRAEDAAGILGRMARSASDAVRGAAAPRIVAHAATDGPGDEADALRAASEAGRSFVRPVNEPGPPGVIENGNEPLAARPGTIDRYKLNPDELKVAQFYADRGYDVEPIDRMPGQKTSDMKLTKDDVTRSVEVKTLSDGTLNPSNRILQYIQDGQDQSNIVVIDTRGSGISRDTTIEALARAAGSPRVYEWTTIVIIGRDFVLRMTK
jgi:hypothetical protein